MESDVLARFAVCGDDVRCALGITYGVRCLVFGVPACGGWCVVVSITFSHIFLLLSLLSPIDNRGCIDCKNFKVYRMLGNALDTGTCMKSCPADTYQNQGSTGHWNRCDVCSSQCKVQPDGGACANAKCTTRLARTCTGASPADCHECANAKDANGMCVAACPSMHFWNVASDPASCQACDSQCSVIQGCTAAGPTNCGKCANFKDGSTCVKTCPAGKEAAADKTCGAALTCSANEYIDCKFRSTSVNNCPGNRLCKSCDPQCDGSGCYGAGPTRCKACKTALDGSTCVTSCPSGMFKVYKLCQYCNANCEASKGCSGGEATSCNACAKAQQTTASSGTTCLAACPTNTTTVSSTNKTCVAIVGGSGEGGSSGGGGGTSSKGDSSKGDGGAVTVIGGSAAACPVIRFIHPTSTTAWSPGQDVLIHFLPGTSACKPTGAVMDLWPAYTTPHSTKVEITTNCQGGCQDKGQVAWKVPASLAPGRYKLALVGASSGGYSDNFWVRSSTLKVIEPTAYSELVAAEAADDGVRVVWQCAGPDAAAVDIDLLDQSDGSKMETLSASPLSCPDDGRGQFVWRVPRSQTNALTDKWLVIRVASATAPATASAQVTFRFVAKKAAGGTTAPSPMPLDPVGNSTKEKADGMFGGVFGEDAWVGWVVICGGGGLILVLVLVIVCCCCCKGHGRKSRELQRLKSQMSSMKEMQVRQTSDTNW